MSKTKGKKKSAEPTDALQDATPEELLDAQQEMLMTGKGAGVGYVGTMSPEEAEDAAADFEKRVNHDSDSEYHPRVAGAVMGRDPDAEMVTDEGEEIGVPGSRVGFAPVAHPRARLASTMHDWLDGAQPSAYSADELSNFAEKVGMNVEASGNNGSVLKSDLVRAFDDLATEYPKQGS